jgi:hypothetical protein
MTIESVKKKQLSGDNYLLKLSLKDFRLIRLSIDTRNTDLIYQYLQKWQNLTSPEKLFAFSFRLPVSRHLNGWEKFDYVSDFERMGLPSPEWRITNVNNEYMLCNSYPQKLYVPVNVTGQELLLSAQFRANGRIPVLVWKNKKGTSLCRSMGDFNI